MNQATTYLRQARSFLSAGDPVRAVELLEKARVLVGNDRQLERQVLEAMVQAYQGAGQPEKASRAQQRLDARFPASPASPANDGPPVAMLARKSRWPLVVFACSGALLLAGAAVVVTAVVISNTAQPMAPAPAAAPRAAKATSTRPLQAATMPAVSQVQPVALGKPSTGPAKTPLEKTLRENVALIVGMAHYEGKINGAPFEADLPILTGTAFAVRSNGLLLTNRHIVEGLEDANAPLSLAPRAPLVTLRERYLVACFGPDAKNHYRATVVVSSDRCDMAVIKVDRRFAHPLTLADQPAPQGADVLVCGFPGVVQEILDKDINTPSHLQRLLKQWDSTGKVNGLDLFNRSSFQSTLTKGIVSAPERNIQGSSYLQTDAAITKGNSGGPVLNAGNQVVGIATLAVGAPDLGKYGFALLVDEFRRELEDAANDVAAGTP